MTLDTVKTEAAPGGSIKADHIDTIVDSLSSITKSVTGNVQFFTLSISCTATDAPVIVNQRDFNFGGTMTISPISAGAYHIIHSGNGFSASSFFHITSKTTNVMFSIGSLLGTSAVEVVIRDTNGYVTSLSANEGFIFKVEN